MRTVIVLICLSGLAGILPAANILPNSSFEDWLFGLPVGWLTSELLFPGSAVQDSSSNTGSYCVKLTGTDTAAFVATVATVTPGRSYEFSGFARVAGALGGSFLLAFLSSAGDTLGEPVFLPAYYSGSEYREYTSWITAPESAAGIAVSFGTLAGLEAYVDDVTLDDTAIGGIAESRISRTAAVSSPRKILFIAGSQGHMVTAAPAFDALGRRVAGSMRSGIYFVVPEK